jgi:hypothetical protein
MYAFTFNGSTYAIGPYTLTVVACIYAVSLVVVLVFDKYRPNISRHAVRFLRRIDIWAAIAFLVFVAWVVSTNFTLFAEVDHALWERERLASSQIGKLLWILAILAHVLGVFSIGAILTFVSVMYLVGQARSYLRELMAFLTLPVLAVITLFGVVVSGVC